jgi:anti-anti-sigma factor
VRLGTAGRQDLERPRSGAVVVNLYGEHDLASAAKLRQIFSVLVLSYDLVVADLSATEFVDSTVLLTLVQVDGQAQKVGSRFRLQLGSEPIVRRALEVTNLLDRFEHYPTREEALRADSPA